jgi:monofunctional biosynthetic peptidoglycan transglycosylase
MKKPLRRLAVVTIAALAAFGAYKAWTWPDVSGLKRRNPETTAFIERWKSSHRSAGRNVSPDWRWVPYAAISPDLKRAVLVSEDIGFFSHHGFELHEMEASLKVAVEEGEVPRGASTITQQVAKNLWLSPSRNPLRKIEEAILTWQLERALDKRRILEIYLNVAELGDGVYGAEAASRRYFRESAEDLSAGEAARLAACLPNPRAWNPSRESRTARHRAERIRELMRKAQLPSL